MKPKPAPISKACPRIRGPILEIKSLRKVFHINGSSLTVLDGIDLSVNKGEMIVSWVAVGVANQRS